jgi:hypothetical protein
MDEEKFVNFRIRNPVLTGAETKTLIEHPELFVLLRECAKGTKDLAQLGAMFRYLPKLKAVIEKWTAGVVV